APEGLRVLGQPLPSHPCHVGAAIAAIDLPRNQRSSSPTGDRRYSGSYNSKKQRAAFGRPSCCPGLTCGHVMRMINAHSMQEAAMRMRDEYAAYGKRATNVSIDEGLLEAARALDINLSATLEKALDAEVRARRREKWLEENRE